MNEPRPVVFGKYCLLERISVGGMAEVYRARRLNTPGADRFLALKRILPNLAADDEFISMFVDEAKITVQLNHRSICQIYELGRLNDSFYIVMEFIAGKDVLALLNWFRKRRKIMSVAQATLIAIRACEGLEYAHTKVDDDGEPLRIIHRDVSPQNVIVSYDGEVKLIDFGIARAANTNRDTQVGVLKGKFGYMSPEQVDAKEIDHRSDIFAAGTLLWEMLTARRLFHADSEFATLEKVRNAPIEPPSAKNPRVPEALDAIVMKALARDRDARYQTAGEMAAALQAFLDEASPSYSEARLAGWMVKNFPEELGAEKNKVRDFASFVSADDIEAYYRTHPELGRAEFAHDGDEEEESATQLFEEGKHARLTGDHVLAANASADTGEPKAVELDVAIAHDAAALDLGDPMADLAAPRAESAPVRVPRSAAAVWTRFALIAVVLAAIVGGAGFAYMQATATGSVRVEPVPADGVAVFVDGVEVSGPSPIVLDGLAPGPHLIEVRHPDHEPYLGEFEVEPNDVALVQPALVALSARSATIGMVLPDSRAQVWLDGRLVGGMGAARTLEVSAAEPHVVEVYLPGHYVEVFELTLQADARHDVGVEFRPVAGTLTVGSEPVADVSLDGEEVGSTDTPLQVDGLDIRGVYELELEPEQRGFRDYRTTVVFDGYGEVRIHPLLSRIGTSDDEPEVEIGELAFAPTREWYRVFVDGRDTGLVTSDASERPLPLKAGERTIGFGRGGELHEVTVQVVAGETTTVEAPTEAR